MLWTSHLGLPALSPTYLTSPCWHVSCATMRRPLYLRIVSFVWRGQADLDSSVLPIMSYDGTKQNIIQPLLDLFTYCFRGWHIYIYIYVYYIFFCNDIIWRKKLSHNITMIRPCYRIVWGGGRYISCCLKMREPFRDVCLGVWFVGMIQGVIRGYDSWVWFADLD